MTHRRKSKYPTFRNEHGQLLDYLHVDVDPRRHGLPETNAQRGRRTDRNAVVNASQAATLVSYGANLLPQTPTVTDSRASSKAWSAGVPRYPPRR